MRLDELAGALGLGFDESHAQSEVAGLCSIDKPLPGHLGFALGPRQLQRFVDANCPLIVLCRREWLQEIGEKPPRAAGIGLIYCESPYDSFVDAMELLHPAPAPAPGIHESAIVSASARIGEGASIGPHSVIGDDASIGERVRIGASCHIGDGASIGADSRLDANVAIYQRCRLGERCRLYANCVIGAEGFGHLPQRDGSWRRIPHLGTVEIGDDVRIGAGTTIDRAVIDATVIESGVKLDNLIHIGHNAHIGRDTAIAAGALVSGHARIGQRCRVAGNASFAAVEIADDTTVLGATSISKNITEPGTTVLGYMGFMPVRRWRRWLAFLHRLEARGRDKRGPSGDGSS